VKTERRRSTVLVLNPGDFFVSSFGFIGSFLLFGWIISGIGSRTETSDKITYLFGCLAALVFGIYSLRKRLIPSTVGLFAASAWLLTITGIAVIEHREMSKEHPMGFGLGVLVFTIAFFLFLNWYFKGENSKKRVNYFLWIPAIFVIVSVALAYWQTSTTLLESSHSEYVINEIWGPAAGYNTYQEFIPQYVYLIGWLVKPILFNLGAEAGTDRKSVV
jgi:MFS family permease